MAKLDVNGVSIHYEEAGSGQGGAALLLVHGFPVDHRMWRGQLAGLGAAGKCRVIAPDTRGLGQSSVAGAYSIETAADDVHALAEALSLGRFVLGGLSMGGYIALAYAKKYPQSLRGLMLMDTRPEGDAPAARENRDKMIATAREQGVKPIADGMMTRLIAESTAKARPRVAEELRQMMESQPVEGVVQALAAMRDRPDQTAMLPGIDVPTLILCGEKDAVTPPDVMKIFHDNIPRSQLRIVPDAGHMSPLEQPEMVNQVMGEFLSPES